MENRPIPKPAPGPRGRVFLEVYVHAADACGRVIQLDRDAFNLRIVLTAHMVDGETVYKLEGFKWSPHSNSWWPR